MASNSSAKQVEDDFASNMGWNKTEVGERYHVQLLPDEGLKVWVGRKSKMYEYDVCQMLPVDDLCWAVSKVPNCVQRLSSEIFRSYDVEIREKPVGCKFASENQELITTTVYFVGWILSFVFFSVLIILKRSAMNDKKASTFESNILIVIIFIWFKQGFHCVKFFTRCSGLGPFIHLCQDSAFMWIFVTGYDLQLERKDLMPPFLYMMSSWVAPLLVALIGAVMSMGRFGLYWLYNSTNVCWITPLYWEIPFVIGPIGVNLYTLALTVLNITSGHMSNPHQVIFKFELLVVCTRRHVLVIQWLGNG